MNKILLGKRECRFAMAVIVMLSVLITSACISESTVKKISDFSDGMNAVMGNTVKVFELVEEKHLERRKAILVNEYTKNPTVIRDFKVKSFFGEDVWDERMKVINGLRTYAVTLKAVIGNDQITEFDASTKALGQKLLAVNEQLVTERILNNKPFSAGEIKIFTTAVNTIGRWFIDFKREKVTRQAIREMNQAVNDVCMLLAKDLGDKPYISDDDPGLNSRAKGLREKLWRNYTDIFNERNQFLSRCITVASQPIDSKESALDRTAREQCKNLYFSAPEMRKEIESLAELSTERRETDDMLAAVQEALLAIPPAHKNLEKAFDKKDVTLPMMISRLFTEAERIKTFYEDLKEAE